MLSIAHTIISLPLGVAFTNPFLIFFAAFFMHFVLDTFLHWNIYPHHYKKYPFLLVGIDVVSGLVLSYLLLENSMFTVSVLAAIAGGNAPDVFHAFWSFLKKDTRKHMPRFIRASFAFHEKIQWETESPLLGGLSQIVLGGIAIFLTLSLR